MLLVDIDVSIRRISDGNLHLWLYYHKAGGEYLSAVFIVSFILLVVRFCVVIVDGELVVSAHGDVAVLVGNCEAIVGIKMVGVERLLDVVDGLLVVPSLQIVGLEESLRNLPVGIAMFYPVGVSMIIVGHVIEVDVDGLPVQQSDGKGLPVGARHYL